MTALADAALFMPTPAGRRNDRGRSIVVVHDRREAIMGHAFDAVIRDEGMYVYLNGQRLPAGVRLVASQVSRLTGATARQLRYWDKIGLARPSLQSTGGRPGRPRTYDRSDAIRLAKLADILAAGRTLQGLRVRLGAGVPMDLLHATRNDPRARAWVAA